MKQALLFMKWRASMHRHLTRFLIFFLIVLFILPSPIYAQSTKGSLSDISGNIFDEGSAKGEKRNPFTPGASLTDTDPRGLNLEGIVTGQKTSLVLIGGQIYQTGQKLGNFLIREIKPGQVDVQSVDGITTLSLPNYVGTLVRGEAFEIAFNNAELAKALRLIAVAGNFNIILPEPTDGRVTVALHQTSLKDALASILRVNQLEYADENGIIRVGKEDDFTGSSYLATQEFSLQYAKADQLVDAIKSHLSEKGKITSDTRTNTVILKDQKAIIDSIMPIIAKLDKQDIQVRIESKIVDVSRNFSRGLGIQWGFTRDAGRVQGFGVDEVGTNTATDNPWNIDLPAAAPSSGFGLLIGNVLNDADLDAKITAAETKGDAHILSQPSITTVNNAPAVIRSGLKIYVKTSSTIAVGGSTGTTSTAEDSGLEEIDTGIQLTVTPQITKGDMIKMKIEAEESEADFSRAVDNIPAVIDNKATTTVLVRNGETTVIGGMLKIKKTSGTSGVPIISSIPLLGWLFKSKTKTKADNELLIFITPTIYDSVTITPTEQAAAISEKTYPNIIDTKKATKKSKRKIKSKRK